MGVKTVTKVSKRSQTHIPTDVQKFLKLKNGDKLLWEEKNGNIYITKWT